MNDIIIIGGGIMGLGIAFEACQKGLHTTLLNKNHIGTATLSSGGMLVPEAEMDNTFTQLLEFALESCEIFPDFIKNVENISQKKCGYIDRGMLLVALNNDHIREYEYLKEWHDKYQLRSTFLSIDDVKKLEPFITPRQLGGLFISRNSQVNPYLLTEALLSALSHLGAKVLQNCDVISIEQKNHRATGVVFKDKKGLKKLSASHIVIGAGAWSKDLLKDILELPLRPIKGQVVYLSGKNILNHVIRTSEVYMVPRSEKDILIGASCEDQGFDTRIRAGVILDLMKEAKILLPHIDELDFVKSTIGFRSVLRDYLPAIGPSGLDGLSIACGHYRHGMMLMPKTAKSMIKGILEEDWETSLTPFLPTRFG